MQEHLVNEVQEVYRLQGVEINDKHIEIIVRQMLRKVKITEPGDTAFLWGDQVDKLDFEDENERVVEKGGKPAEAAPVLLGITKASLETDRFISRRVASRTPPASSPKPRPWAASITCAASRKTSSWVTSSRPAPASRCTAT